MDMTANHATFTIERILNATPQRVFNAFADEDSHRRWFVEGEGFEDRGHHHDFKVGGRETTSFGIAAINQVCTNSTTYFDIVENKRIVFAYSMQMEGAPPFSVSLATIELSAEGSKTKLLFTEQAAFLENADGPAMRQQGWNDLFDALARELVRTAAAA